MTVVQSFFSDIFNFHLQNSSALISELHPTDGTATIFHREMSYFTYYLNDLPPYAETGI